MAGPVCLLVCLLAAAVAPAHAQNETVLSSVAFMLYGERTPLHGPTATELTPVGAQQMYAQGAVLRARYLDGVNTTFTEAMELITTHAPIDGIETNALDNGQLAIVSTDDSYVATGALAFLQGLYPPQTAMYAYGNGGRESAVLADNNTVVAYPLSGYQYPLVLTVSSQDPTSSWIAGNAACTQYQEAAIAYRDDNTVSGVFESTQAFYDSLWPTIFQGVFQQSMTNFYYAYDLYDYAAYEYNHNPQIANALSATDLAYLRLLAYTQQLDINANLSVSGDEYGDMIQAVSGRMLATYVLSLLKENINSLGYQNKLNLLFGSFEPFLAFFALSGLSSGPNATAFQSLPGQGAVMAFELYTTATIDDDDTSSAPYPSTDDLRVRFLYRPDTDNETSLNQYGLFAKDASVTSMTYDDFARNMGGIGISGLAAWCEMCDSVSIFCDSLLDNTSDGSSSSGSSSSSSSGSSSGSSSAKYAVTPPVAGVIGALVTLGVMGLAVLAAMLLGGLRLCHVPANSKNNGLHFGGYGADGSKVESVAGGAAAVVVPHSGGGGGFKGPEKKVSDTDVVVSPAGAHHERVGSWELRDNGSSSSGSSPVRQHDSVVEVLQKDANNVKSSARYSTEDDHDHDLNLAPVVPVEHV